MLRSGIGNSGLTTTAPLLPVLISAPLYNLISILMLIPILLLASEATRLGPGTIYPSHRLVVRELVRCGPIGQALRRRRRSPLLLDLPVSVSHRGTA